GEERRLVDQVAQVGADEARRGRGDLREVDVGRQRYFAGVDLQDRRAAGFVGRLDHHAAVEAPWPQQRLVQHVRPIRRCQHDHRLAGGEAVHLGQDLVQRLLLLGVRAETGRTATRTPDSVELVDEDDGWTGFARLLE